MHQQIQNLEIFISLPPERCATLNELSANNPNHINNSHLTQKKVATFVEKLKYCQELHTLNLSQSTILQVICSNNSIFKKFIFALKKCRKLENFYLSSVFMNITHTQADILGNTLGQLAIKHLNFSNNHRLTRQHLSLIAPCQQLENLNLSSNDLYTADLTDLQNLNMALKNKAIKNLNLYQCRIGMLELDYPRHFKTIIEMLGVFSQLETLNLGDNKLGLITPASWQDLTNCLSSLTKIRQLENFVEINGDGAARLPLFIKLLSHYPDLENIDLAFHDLTTALTAENEPIFIQAFQGKKLKFLNLQATYHVSLELASFTRLTQVLNACTSYEILNLENNSLGEKPFTKEAWLDFSHALKNKGLKELNLNSNSLNNLTPEILQDLMQTLAQSELRELSLQDCIESKNDTPNNLNQTLKFLPHDKCNNIKLHDNNLHQLAFSDWRDLAARLNFMARKSGYLDLSNYELIGYLTLEKLTLIVNNFSPNISFINLRVNSLEKLSTEHWQVLLNGMSKLHLQSLNLTGNFFEHISSLTWGRFLDFISAQTELKTLKLSSISGQQAADLSERLVKIPNLRHFDITTMTKLNANKKFTKLYHTITSPLIVGPGNNTTILNNRRILFTFYAALIKYLASQDLVKEIIQIIFKFISGQNNSITEFLLSSKTTVDKLATEANASVFFSSQNVTKTKKITAAEIIDINSGNIKNLCNKI